MEHLHSSIRNAVNGVEAEGVNHINKYFHAVDASDTMQTMVSDDSINKIKEHLSSNQSSKALELLISKQVNKELILSESAVKSIKFHIESNAPDKAIALLKSYQNDSRKILRPKMVSMAFPTITSNGPATHYVDVPLITLTPISTLLINEVNIKTSLEITVDSKDNIMVSFPQKKQPGIFSSHSESTYSNTEIEIKFRGGETPEGLQKVIEGYERALRAQIPG